MKRLFVAIPISEKIQKKALEFQKAYTSLQVRWLTGKNLHITIIPPWYENDPNRIKNILNEFSLKADTSQTNPSPTGPLAIKFNNISYGPNPAAPRLIWASGQTPTKLIQFKKNLESLFLKEKILKQQPACGGPFPFLLHLTLARFRPEDFKDFPIQNLSEQIDWPETLHTFVLMESHLSSAGADYEILEQFKL